MSQPADRGVLLAGRPCLLSPDFGGLVDLRSLRGAQEVVKGTLIGTERGVAATAIVPQNVNAKT